MEENPTTSVCPKADSPSETLSPQTASKKVITPKTYAVPSVDVLTQSPHTLALLFLLILTSLLMLSLDVVSDVFQLASGFPSVPVVVTSNGLCVFSLAVTVAMGTHILQHFHMFDLLEGGEAFFAMQMSGYGLSLSSMVLKLLFVMEIRAHHTPLYGGLSALGVAAIFGHSLLVSSFLYFVMPPKNQREEFRFFRRRRTPGETKAYRDVVTVAVLFGAVLLSTSVTATWAASEIAGVLHDGVLVSFLLCAMTVIQLRGARTRGSAGVTYSSVEAYCGSTTGTMAQVWAHLLLGGAVFAIARVHVVGSCGEEAVLWRIGSTFAAVAAVVIHALLLYTSEKKRLGSTTPAPRTDPSVPDEGNEAVLGGRHLFLTVMAVCVFVTVQALGIISLTSEGNRLGSINDPLSLEAYKESGLLQLQSMLGLVLCMMPPLTHFQGRLVFGQRFEIWNPFGGNGYFLLIQIVSWTSYGAAGLAFILHLTHPRRLHFSLITTLLLLSQLGMQMSLRYFDQKKFLPPRSSLFSGDKNAIRSMNSIQRTSIVIRTVFNGELILAVVLAALSIILRSVCDVEDFIQLASSSVSSYKRFHMYLEPRSVLHIANAFSFMSVPVAHISMRHHIRLLVDMDQRSTGYVLLVTIGWTTYVGGSLAGLLQLLLYGWEASPSLSSHGFMFYYTAEGMFFSVPLLCLVCAFIFEMNQILRSSIRCSEIEEMIDNVRAWIEHHTAETSISERQEVAALLNSLEAQMCRANPAVTRKNAEDRDSDAVRDAAYYMTALTSVVSTSIFIVAALLVGTGRVVPIAFGMTGLTVVTLSCCNLQYFYGHRLHDGGQHAYHFVMPFRGGQWFVLQQSIGWSAFTVCWLLMVATSMESQPSAGNLLILAGASALAQLCILISFGYYDGEKAAPDNFVARSPEGLMAAATISGSFFFSRLYEASTTRPPESQGGVGMASLVPVVVCALSVIVAVPMGLISLQRQAQDTDKRLPSPSGSSENLPGSTTSRSNGRPVGLEEEEEDTSELEGKPMQNAIWLAFSPPGFRRDLVSREPAGTFPPSMAATRYRRRYFVSSLSRLLALFVVYLFPFIALFLFYAYHLQLEAIFCYSFMALKSLGVAFAMFLTLPVVIPVLLGSKKLPHIARQAYYFACAWFMWSVPTMTVVGGLSPPFFVPTWGSWLWFGNMTIMCCLSTIPRLPTLMLILNNVALGLFINYHFYFCWYTKMYELQPLYCAADLFAACLWIWYGTRYYGQPHITGRLFNASVRRFFKKYVFYGATRYFNIKVIRVEPYTIPEELVHMGEREAEQSVDRRDPKNQYLFSFHPHGVFPGSSLYVPCTAVWEDLIGTNEKNKIITHAADVIFMCPFMRELPLCVGALSVARRSIENSIKNGNSPLIITGGQSEMLLTKWSQTEMHLVCHHLGFIKLAMRHHIPLVPVISFSECNIMENVHWLKVQRWFVKRIGFPALVLPHGFCYLPLPAHLPITVVVGHPIRPYPMRDNPDDPACVEEMRARYFNHLQTVFYKYRAEAGYPNMVLYLHNGIYDTGLRIPPPDEVRQSDEDKK